MSPRHASRRSLFSRHQVRARRRPRFEMLEPRHLLNGLPLSSLESESPRILGLDLGSVLREYEQSRAVQPIGEVTTQLATAGVQTQGDRVLVDAVASGSTSLLAADLAQLGMEVTGTYGRYVSGWLPIEAISTLDTISSLQFARPVLQPMAQAGSVNSQGDVSMRTDEIRNFFHFDGAGQTVGVLSDSFNNLGGAAADVLSADLPGPGNPNGYTTTVNVVQDNPSGGTDEGRAMLQLVHDVAPAADLAFATANGGTANFASNILNLRNAGCTAIVDDIIYYAEPMFQDGAIAQAVDTVVAGGVPYFSSAGNQARQSYESAYRAGTAYPAGSFGSASFLGGTAHDFDPGAGVDTMQRITVPANSNALFIINWDSPWFSVSGGTGCTSEMDLYVLDSAGTSVMYSDTVTNIGGDAFLGLAASGGGSGLTFNLMLVNRSVPAPTQLKYVYFGGATINDFPTNSATTYGHANAHGAAAVGAAYYLQTPEYGVSPAVLESFSSAGGTPIYFDTSGNRIGPIVRQSPDFTAPDGTDTTFFGGDSDGNGRPNFFGTSASAPHAAALASLVMQAQPGLTPSQVYGYLESTASNMGAPGFDYDTGWGFVNGVNAFLAANGPTPTFFDGTNNADQFLIRRDASRTNLQFYLNSALQFTLPYASVQDVTVSGLGGNDNLTIDYLNGDPIPAGGINYDGGGQTAAPGDSLTITGTGTQHGFYYPDGLTAGDGRMVIDGGQINFTGLAPALVSGLAEFTLVTGNSNDSLTVDSPAAGQNRVSGTSGGVAIEALTFFNVTNFKIDTATHDNPLANPNDTVAFTSDLVATGLGSFTVDLGAGCDRADATLVTTLGMTLLGGSGDDILAGSDSTSPSYIDGGDGNDRITGQGGSFVEPDILLGGEGNDFIFIANGFANVDAGEGADVVNFTETVGTTGDFSIQADGGKVQVQRITAGPAIASEAFIGVAEEVNVIGGTTTANFTVRDLSGTGLESLGIGFLRVGDQSMSSLAIGGTVSVDGTPAADVIAIDNALYFSQMLPTVIVPWGRVRMSQNTIPATATLAFNALGGDDVVQVNSGFSSSLFASVRLDGGDGDDLLVGSSHNETLIGGNGDDTFVGGGGTDTVTGGNGFDTILVEGTDGADTISVADAVGVHTVIVNGVTTTYAASSVFDRILVAARDGNDSVTISGAVVGLVVEGGAGNDILNAATATTAVTLLGGAGNDTFTAAQGGGLLDGGDDDDTFNVFGGITGQVTVIGGEPSASDVLKLTGAAATAESVLIAPDSNPTQQVVTGLGMPVNVSGVELISYTGLGTNDTLTVNTGGGNDTARVDAADTSTHTDSVLSSSLPEIRFSGLQTFVLNMGGGNNAATFVPTALSGALAANYRLAGIANALIIEGRDGQGDNFEMQAPGAGLVTVTTLVTGVTVTAQASAAGRIEVRGLGGDDTLTIDLGSVDVLPFPSPDLVTFDGGSGRDTLTVSGTPVTPVDEVIHTLGTIAGEGRLTYENAANAVLTVIDYANLEPVVDLVPAATLTVNATDADNAIDYTASGANGLVTVDNFESTEFANKTTLVINAGAGRDVINLNNASTPSGLTGITVNGDDPTGSDLLIVNGVAATVGVALNTGIITGASGAAGAVPITYATIEELKVVAGPTTTLNLSDVSASAINYVYTPGAAADAGAVQTRTIPVSFTGLVAGRTLSLQGDGVAPADSVTINGTGANDAFTVVAGTGGIDRGDVTITGRVTIDSDNITDLVLNGLEGDDTFIVAAAHAYTTVAVWGGDPSASDVANLNGSGAPVVANIGASDGTASVTGGGLGTVNLSGVELLNLNAGTQALTVNGTGNDDSLSITPWTANTGTLQANGVSPVVNFSGTTTLTVDLLAGNDTATVIGTSAADTIAVDRTASTVQVGARQTVTIVSATVEAVVIQAGLGNDTINVSGTGGLAGLTIDGQQPSATPGQVDTLTVTTVTAGTITSRPGAADESGWLDTPDGNISFYGIEVATITATAGADTLVAQGTNDGDQIALANDGANRIWVNNHTVLAFSAVETVTLQGRFGDDRFSVSPVGLGGVTTVNVDGGDPTASDELVVSGTSTQETIDFAPTGVDAGSVAITGAPMVTFTTTESIVINGGGGDDNLTVTTPSGLQIIYLEDGLGVDAGSVTIRDAVSAGGERLVPMSFLNIGGNGSLVFADAAALASDQLVFSPRDVANATDFFNVDAAGVILLRERSANGSYNVDLVPVTGPGIIAVVLNGLSGDDRFTVAGGHPYTGGVLLNGGDPSGSDVVTLIGDATLAITVTLDPVAPQVTGGGLSTVRLLGIEVANVTNGAGGIWVDGDTGPDAFAVTPTGVSTATIESEGVAPLINTDNTGFLQVRAAGGGSNTLAFNGTDASDNIVVNINSTLLWIPGLKPIFYAAVNIDAVSVFGRAGADTFTVTPGTEPVFVDGGDPIGVLPGDHLVIDAGGAANTFYPGPEPDAGAFLVTGSLPVSFDQIESGTVINPGPVTTLGTDGEDNITIIARDATTHAGADGVQDFTVAVNAGLEVLYLNAPSLFVSALGCSDEIAVQTPSPFPAGPWGVALTIDGGLPTGSDKLIVGTPGSTDTVQYTPDGPDNGLMVITNLATSISILQVEHLVYDGEAGADTLSVIGGGINQVSANERFVHTPGAAFDAGRVDIARPLGATFLGIDYQNLGTGGVVTIQDGGTAPDADVVVALGGGGSDTMQASFTALNAARINLTDAYGAHIDLRTVSIESYELRTLEGDDRITIQAPINISGTVSVAGGGPGGSDTLSISGAAGTNEAFIVSPSTVPGEGTVSVAAIPTTYTGIEHLFLAGNVGDTDSLLVNDDLRDNLWEVSSGTVGDLVQIAGRESMDYWLFDTVRLANGYGTDWFRVFPTSLVGYATSLTVTGNTPINNVLELVGTPGTDNVTSTANAVTINGRAVTAGANLAEVRVVTLDGDDLVTLGLALPGVRKFIDAGAGNDVVNVSAMADATIFGGDGDDLITGSPLADFIAGGRGNDTILGLGGDDTIYGDEGDDTITGGTGNDFLFGGDGSDVFIWNNGDNTDGVEGDTGVDVQVVNGAAAGDAFLLRTTTADPGRAFLERTNLVPFSITMGNVEEIDLNGLAGPDTFEVRDLATTDVRVVNIDAGPAGDLETFAVHGRTVADNLNITASAGVVNVAGLRYDVNISAAVAADGDRLTVFGNDGNDTIKAADGVEATVLITLDGGLGDDYLSADAIVIGGPGNDFLEGGSGADQLFGGPGEDTMIGRGGLDTYDGGPDFDTILIEGTSDNDLIDVSQTAATTLVYTVNGATEIDTLVLLAGVRTVECAHVVAGDGDDNIRINWLDALGVDAFRNSLRMEVDGGAAFTRDRLVVPDDGLGDLMLYRKGELDSTGAITVGPGNAEPLELNFQGIEYVQPLPLATGRLTVFKHDPYENNNEQLLATHLGSGPVINIDPTIDPGALAVFGAPADEDWYRFEAQNSGTLDMQVFFGQIGTLPSGRPGLPNDGNLDIQVYDADGTLIAGGGPLWGTNDATDNERIRIPAVQGQIYFLRVFANGTAINNYTMTVINTAPPVPYDIELRDNPVGDPPPANSDTGRSEFDNITYDNTPTVVFRLDDATFLNDLPGNDAPDTPPDEVIVIPFQGITLLPGYRIGIFDEGSTPGGSQVGVPPQTPLGFAIATAQPGVYEFTTPVLADGSHFLTARVQMIDPATPTQTGWGDRSLSLEIIVDTVIPPVSFGQPGVPDDGLAPDSDTGVSPPNQDTITDNITSDTTPKFWGRAEADTIVRVYADVNGNGTLETAIDVYLGQATAIPLDGSNQEPDGYWEIQSIVDLNDPTFFPVPDGLRTIFVTAEDVAGNVNSPAGAADVLRIFIDTQGPVIEGVFISDTDLVGIGAGNTLLRFNSGNPDVILATVPVTGLVAGDTIVGMDLRPANNTIYAVADGLVGDRIYTVQPLTGVATLVSTLSVPLAGTSFGVDFDPVADRLRIVSDADQNLRVNVATGVAIVDGALNPGNPTVVAAAYSNNVAGATTTTLYTIDTAADVLNIQNPANAGTQVPVGPLGVNATNVAGFEIAPGSNHAFASLTVGGLNRLYRINLSTGAATLVDSIGTGATAIGGLTAVQAFDLFDPKASADGPTPLVYSLTIPLEDPPLRVAPDFLYRALKEEMALEPGNYRLVGDASGVIAIKEVILQQFLGSDNVARATVQLVFFEPLPDDRYTLTVSDELRDIVGNRLDGENNAIEPQETPLFPTGDGAPGGTFVARFTVDSRPEMAVWDTTSVYIDTNGNALLDPQNLDAVNRDVIYQFPFTPNHVFAGNFTLGPIADGFDKLAAYQRIGDTFTWHIDVTNDGLEDLVRVDPASITGFPIAGNFDGNAVNGSEVGLFDGTTWWLDVNRDFQVASSPADLRIPSAIFGLPTVGDFDGDGKFDLATWKNAVFYFDLGFNGYGQQDASIARMEFIGARDRVVAADMDADGVTDIGVWIPDRSGAATDQLGEWYILVSNDLKAEKRVTGSVGLLDHVFSERPFGHDIVARFGAEFAIPVLGNFDPPVVAGAPLVVVDQTTPLPEYGLPGLYDPTDSRFFLKNSQAGGDADEMFNYGVAGLGWVALSGDWNGDSVATVGFYDPATSTFFLKNSHAGGDADVMFTFGVGGLGWQPIVGDWNADGIDTVGLYDPANGVFFLKNSQAGGDADVMFTYGIGGQGWQPLSGDWDGDGQDTVGLYVPSQGAFFLKNSHASGDADAMFAYGIAGQGWLPLTGNWDQQGGDTIGLYEPQTGMFFLRNQLAGGDADLAFQYGIGGSGWKPIVGDWKGLTTDAITALPAANPVNSPLAASDLAAIAAATYDAYQAGGLPNDRLAKMRAVGLILADLPGDLVSVRIGNDLYFDRTAAGRGWFVDSTPRQDEEFQPAGDHLQAVAAAAVDRIDLATVVSQELGHATLDDLAGAHDKLLSGQLGVGVRKLPDEATIAAIFGA